MNNKHHQIKGIISKMFGFFSKAVILISIMVLSAGFAYSQQISRKLTLMESIEIAKRQSPDALSAKNQFLTNFWEYRNFKANLLPRLSLQATVPQLTRAIESVIQPDGTSAFRERSLLNSSANLELRKNIGLTGGQIYLSSGLQIIDYLSSDNPTAYLSNPMILGFSQSLFTYNPFKWQKRIDPIKYNEARQKYLENVEQIAITTTNLFFNLLTTQIQKNIADIKMANYDTLYKIAIGRYNMGKIAENDLLQLELSLLKSQAEVEDINLQLYDRTFKLKSYLRLQDKEGLELVIPDQISYFTVDVDKAIELALNNQSKTLGFQRRLLEAEAQVENARKTDRFSANVFAQFGLTKSTEEIGQLYVDPIDQQLFTLGLQIPILDWGLAKGRIKVAQSNSELIKTAVEQEKIDFNLDIYLKVVRFNQQKIQLEIAAKSDTVAQKGYNVSKERYLIGKISITDLNIAQTDKDNSKISYLRTLQDYWTNYFDLRRTTLYDFVKNEGISVDFDALGSN